MRRHWLVNVLLLVLLVMTVAAACDVVVIVSEPVRPWLAWMLP